MTTPESEGHAVLTLGLLIGDAAARADRFHSLPDVLAGASGLPWARVAVVRTEGDAGAVLRDVASRAGGAFALPASDLIAWCAGPGRVAPRGSGHVDRVVDGRAERWSVCHVDASIFLLVRWAWDGVTDARGERATLLAEHAARMMCHSVLWHARPGDFAEPLNQLTPKEWEVLKALQSADAEKQIAGDLGLSTHTFHVHVKKIYRKLNVRSRLSLLELCRRIEQERLIASLIARPEPAGRDEVSQNVAIPFAVTTFGTVPVGLPAARELATA